MNYSLRNDERKRTEAILEQKALEKVLKIINNNDVKTTVNSQKYFTKFFEDNRHAKRKNLINNEKKWISRHKSSIQKYSDY